MEVQIKQGEVSASLSSPHVHHWLCLAAPLRLASVSVLLRSTEAVRTSVLPIARLRANTRVLQLFLLWLFCLVSVTWLYFACRVHCQTVCSRNLSTPWHFQDIKSRWVQCYGMCATGTVPLHVFCCPFQSKINFEPSLWEQCPLGCCLNWWARQRVCEVTSASKNSQHSAPGARRPSPDLRPGQWAQAVYLCRWGSPAHSSGAPGCGDPIKVVGPVQWWANIDRTGFLSEQQLGREGGWLVNDCRILYLKKLKIFTGRLGQKICNLRKSILLN